MRLSATFAGLAIGALALAPGAAAKTFEVTQRSDPRPGRCDEDCSVREAVIAAGERAGGDVVSMPTIGPHNLRRASSGEDAGLDGDLDVTAGPLKIVHTGRGYATIDANGIDRALDIENAKVRIEGIVIANGVAHPGDGAGDGGGLNAGPGSKVTVANSRLFGNQAPDVDGNGGAIDSDSEKLFRVIGSEIIGNDAAGEAGGIGGSIDGPVRISDSLITQNEAGEGGGVLVVGPISIESTTIAYNRSIGHLDGELGDGGAIYIDNQGLLDIENSTLMENSAFRSGGGLYAEPDGIAAINAVTIARNAAAAGGDGTGEAGGLYAADPAPRFDVANTIIAENTVKGSPSDCGAAAPESIRSGGANLLSTQEGGCGFAHPGDLFAADPGLGVPSANRSPGGLILPLEPGSPAIDAANLSAPSMDQRGRGRDARPDIGAAEFGAAP